jgi:CheY-like chemotaxis protein
MPCAHRVQHPSVLVADDQPVLRDTLSALLACEGWDCRPLADGDAVRAALRAGPAPDAVLLDRGMPGPGLAALVAEVRRLAPRARIVVLTGDPRAATMALRDQPADAVLAKPCAAAALLAALAGAAALEVV